MPFAPVVLEKYAKEYFINYESKRNKAAKYMTMTYFVTDLCKEKAPAVVHIDGTARPQVIDSSLNNSMTKILENYYSITGTPILVNTSFNMHEEPIINTPLEAVKSFKISGLDYLALGDYMISAENVVKLSV